MLDGVDDLVPGLLSTGTKTSGQNANQKFDFTAVDGSFLILNASKTYRCLTVSQSVMNLIKQDTSKTYLYTEGGRIDPATSTTGDTVTISNGLVCPIIHGHFYCGWKVPADPIVITQEDGIFAMGTLFSVFTEIKGAVVPEFATATLGLLGLAALMARRRSA